jgi:dTDP-4-amino-4,6-dideoxygalactose transaminase
MDYSPRLKANKFKMLNYSSPLENNKKINKKIFDVISNTINSGQYILGKNVKLFEEKLAKYLRVKHVIALNSGTDALIVSLMCINVGKNDEVIVPSHTATATISSIQLLGAKPVFADINLENYTIDTKKISALITSRTKAIIAVHIYGHSCDNFEILKICKKNKIYFIEDCAQAIGSELNEKKLGTFGDFGCFSFFPTKNLSAIGDAGAVVTNNYNYYKKLKKIRQYGWNEKRISMVNGINSRCDELQAAILNVKIKFLDQYIKKRRKVAKFYNFYLKKLPIILPVEDANCKHSYHLYVIRVRKSIRDLFIHFMKRKKIFLGIHYKKPTHLMYNFNKNKIYLKNTEKISKEIISLPMYPELSRKKLLKIFKEINLFYRKQNNLYK